MNKSLRITFILVALCVVFGSVAAQAQRAGSYREIDKEKEEDREAWAEAQAAAEFAVKAQGEKQNVTINLVSVEHAEQQVVAGKNFKLCLKVEVSDDSSESAAEEVSVVVYRNLQQQYSLTSWEAADCGGGGDN
jgi:hypothetical protein